ncbi:MAG: ADP-ribosylglycohydrolase family protein [Deltaproteobacteria bacterium]|nr:ADP-ribosylglycohydrolase family protein [Deltaproteobacteria bacterium]
MESHNDYRSSGALYGLCIGDALAMPVHWYYNHQALFRDYGRVTDYLAPRNPHPDSILWRSKYVAKNARGEILHDQANYWGQRGVHYHQFLAAGENTLNIKISQLLIESLMQNGRYDLDDFLKRYIQFMTTPGNHRDTYIEECHRNFFENYAAGTPPRNCGLDEKHIGGLVGIIPIIVFYCSTPEQARSKALEHLALTHPGIKMADAASLVIELLLRVLKGKPLHIAILEEIEKQRTPLVGHAFVKWLDHPDDMVIGPRFSTACYVEDSVPAVLYLALKYHADPEKALIVNTNLGGDNAARGSVLGALLGASHGIEGFPRRWIDGLVDPPPDFLQN